VEKKWVISGEKRIRSGEKWRRRREDVYKKWRRSGKAVEKKWIRSE
jgi:hypothetical protein